MLIRHAMDFLYLCPLIKCKANYVFSSLKVPMELSINLLNHTLAGPFNIVGKASIYGIWNFTGRGNEVIGAVKGESVRWTNSSRSFDTHLWERSSWSPSFPSSFASPQPYMVVSYLWRTNCWYLIAPTYLGHGCFAILFGPSFQRWCPLAPPRDC